jgi:hypothetical protein
LSACGKWNTKQAPVWTITAVSAAQFLAALAAAVWFTFALADAI